MKHVKTGVGRGNGYHSPAQYEKMRETQKNRTHPWRRAGVGFSVKKVPEGFVAGQPK